MKLWFVWCSNKKGKVSDGSHETYSFHYKTHLSDVISEDLKS